MMLYRGRLTGDANCVVPVTGAGELAFRRNFGDVHTYWMQSFGGVPICTAGSALLDAETSKDVPRLPFLRLDSAGYTTFSVGVGWGDNVVAAVRLVIMPTHVYSLTVLERMPERARPAGVTMVPGRYSDPYAFLEQHVVPLLARALGLTPCGRVVNPHVDDGALKRVLPIVAEMGPRIMQYAGFSLPHAMVGARETGTEGGLYN